MIPSSLSREAKQPALNDNQQHRRRRDEVKEEEEVADEAIWTLEHREPDCDLWTQRSFKISAKYAENHPNAINDATTSTKVARLRVRDVIPESRLASYGNYEYGKNEIPSESGNKDDNDDETEWTIEGEPKEPWMLDEVGKFVASMRRRRKVRSVKCDGTLREPKRSTVRIAPSSLVRKEDDDEDELPEKPTATIITDEAATTTKTTPPSYVVNYVPPRRYSVTNVSEAQLEGRITSQSVRNIWRADFVKNHIDRAHRIDDHQQTEQLARELKRELGLLQKQHSSRTRRVTGAENVVQRKSYSSCFHNERIKILTNDSSCHQQYQFIQTPTVLNATYHHQRQKHHRARPPSLCADVPEFFPKGPSSCTITGTNDVTTIATTTTSSWPLNTSLSTANYRPDDDNGRNVNKSTIQYACVDSPTNDNNYADGPSFSYKSRQQQHQHQHVAVALSNNVGSDDSARMMAAGVAVYQNAVLSMVPTAPLVSAVLWPTQLWSNQRMLPTIQLHQMVAPPQSTISPSQSGHQPMTTIQQQQPSHPQITQNQSSSVAPIPSAPQPQAATCPTNVVHRNARVREETCVKTLQSHGNKVSHHVPVYHSRIGKTNATLTSSEYNNQRRKNQGVDFNNLILLTKSAMKVRRNNNNYNNNQTSRKIFFGDTFSSSSSSSSSSMPKSVNVTSKADSSTRWFDKGYHQASAAALTTTTVYMSKKREREYVTVNTKGSRHSQSYSASGIINVIGGSKISTMKNYENADEVNYSISANNDGDRDDGRGEKFCSRKRLYCDVVVSSGCPDVGTVGNNDDVVEANEQMIEDNFYDELERQALEQYRISAESLALKYQELEQQALERYGATGSSYDSINLGFESQNFRNDEDDERASFNNRTVTGNDHGDNVHDSATRDFRSSGFGKYIIRKKPSVDEEKGNNELQRQRYYRAKIPRAEAHVNVTAIASTSSVVVHRASSEGCLRPIPVAKRLDSAASFVNQGRESKNTFKDGTGDKIAKASSLSWLKSTSPWKRSDNGDNKSGIMRNAILDPLKAVQKLDKHVAATYYRNSRVIQTGGDGGGDDKVDHDAGVWLSNFWS